MKYLLFLCVVCFSSVSYAQNEETGKQFIFSLLEKKDFDRAYTFFDPSIASEIPIEELGQLSAQLESQLGKFRGIIETSRLENVFYYYTEFENAKIDIQVSLNKSDKVVGFFLVPHKEINKKGDVNDFTINSGGIQMAGTLLIPEHRNQKKLVIFIHGSGPQDRDEKIFDNRPFKDIAEGLSNQGIASYRFDKRTFSNPESFSVNSTIDDEYTKDVLNIIAFFKSHEIYKNYEIILLGHSLGGHLLPRIYNRDKRVSKLIFLAANARGLDELLLEQYEYMLSLDPGSKELKQEIDTLRLQIDKLHSGSTGDLSNSKDLPLGLPYEYWKSLMEYDPLKEAAGIKVPVQVLQGERDYQVTMKDFKLWKKAIKSAGSEFISYPGLNHIFMKGQGKPTPDEYAVANTVYPEVIKDIANFILTR